MPRGKINNRDFALQVRDFTGLLFGTITPTDIDCLIEYKNECFIFVETKYLDAEVPFGQKLALERLCDQLKRPSIFIITEHNTRGDIDMANTMVRKYYLNKEWHYPKNKSMKLKDAIDKFLSWVENK